MVNDSSIQNSGAEVLAESTEPAPAKAPRTRRAPAKKASAKLAAKSDASTEVSIETPLLDAPLESVEGAENTAVESAKKPPRKAPARRSRAKAGVAVTPPSLFDAPAEATTTRDAPAATTGDAETAESVEVPTQETAAKKAPAKKAPAKRAPRRRASAPVTAPASELPSEQSAAAVVEETPAEMPAAVAPAEEPADEPADEAAPAKRTTRRRTAKKSVAVETESTPDTAADTAEEALIEAEEVPAAPLFASASVGMASLFLAPDLSLAIPAPQAATETAEETDANERTGSRRSRNRRNRPVETAAEDAQSDDQDTEDTEDDGVTSRRRRRRRRGDQDLELTGGNEEDPPNTVTKVRAPRVPAEAAPVNNRVTSLRGSTRLEAKKQRRRDSRDSGRRRSVITEAEFLARRESVDRVMVVRQNEERIQIGVLEDGILAEHFVSKTQQDSLIGNVYLGKVQNVLPSMEAAFVDIGRGRNAVLYAGEVDWDAAHLNGQPRRIENALKSGDSVLVQVSKDPVGQKGARLTSQISLPGRYLVYVPAGSMTGISRKLPDVERNRLKRVLRDHLPENAGVIVRTAAEGASEEELTNDINRLRAQWERINDQASSKKTLAPEMLYAEPDLTIKVVRDVFNEDFSKLVIAGDEAWDTIEAYVTYVAPDLLDRLEKWSKPEDIFAAHRIDEQISKALERKVFLPSGGSLVIDRTEAMTVVDVNTGKFTGSGGNLEETVTKNNLEAAEEVVRQLRLRDIGGIIVIDFIDMVLESNRDLVLRRLVECLGRDRTKHQVAEVTSLGLIQMTRKRMGTGLLEVFGEQCEVCAGRGMVTHEIPVEHRLVNAVASDSHHTVAPVKTEHRNDERTGPNRSTRSERKRNRNNRPAELELPAVVAPAPVEVDPAVEAERAQKATAARAALASIAAAAASHHESHNETVAPAQLVTGGEPEVPASSEQVPTVTFDGEAIELPRGHQHDVAASNDAADRLAGLAQALDQLVEAHEAGGASAPVGAGTQSTPSHASSNPRSRRPRRNRSARSAQGSADTAVERSDERTGSVGVSAVAAQVAPAGETVAVQPAPVKKAPQEIVMLGVGVPASEL